MSKSKLPATLLYATKKYERPIPPDHAGKLVERDDDSRAVADGPFDETK